MNKLTQEQRNMVISTTNNATYRDLPPCKIVPLLADVGQYIASESTFYRILRAENQLTRHSAVTFLIKFAKNCKKFLTRISDFDLLLLFTRQKWMHPVLKYNA